MRELGVISDAAGLRRLGLHAAVIVATGALVYAASGPARLFAVLGHGIALVTLFAPLHEATHRTAFRRRWLNDAVALVAGLALAAPARHFRWYHLAHHRHAQDPEHDPELAARKPETLGAYLLHVAGLPYWRARASELVGHAAGRVTAPWVPERARAAVVREARAHLALYVSVCIWTLTAGATAPLIYWLGPLLLGQPFLRLYLLPEHAGCAESSDPLASTRTMWTNPLVRGLMWNMPYHTAHHADPTVPFHALPAFHTRLGPVQNNEPGYLAFHLAFVHRLTRP